MKKIELRVFANSKSGELVTNLEQLDAGNRRFIGWKFDKQRGEDEGEMGAFVPQVTAEILRPSCSAHYTEYLRALKCGEILPGDEETAQLAGVSFRK